MRGGSILFRAGKWVSSGAGKSDHLVYVLYRKSRKSEICCKICNLNFKYRNSWFGPLIWREPSGSSPVSSVFFSKNSIFTFEELL